jgi:hypothetical protein
LLGKPEERCKKWNEKDMVVEGKRYRDGHKRPWTEYNGQL